MTVETDPAMRRRMPSLARGLGEPFRTAGRVATLPLAAPVAACAPRGDGHTVVVLPGLLGGDGSTRPLRSFLQAAGYRARPWELGRNIGPTPEILDGIRELLLAAAEPTAPVSLIGWSLGGIYARELAREHPALVRQVITLVSPFALRAESRSRAHWAYRRFEHRHARPGLDPDGINRPIPVPSTSVYSRADGIVDWRDCIGAAGPHHENIAVRSGHFGAGVDPLVMWLVADRLAQPLGTWRPFVPPRALRLGYRVGP
ncbi:esterase/lipase family protein [Marmoricola sp. RAF53]|uniref:esterase/lipase family protein n=1 Tax=Marmoricola sp. RAF53 TaxID=3233059 RepID=UPI003F9934FE